MHVAISFASTRARQSLNWELEMKNPTPSGGVSDTNETVRLIGVRLAGVRS
jgi:hypothetical protein